MTESASLCPGMPLVSVREAVFAKRLNWLADTMNDKPTSKNSTSRLSTISSKTPRRCRLRLRLTMETLPSYFLVLLALLATQAILY